MKKIYWIGLIVGGSLVIAGCKSTDFLDAKETSKEQSEVKKFSDLSAEDLKKIRKDLGWDEYLEKTKQMSYEEAKKRWGQKPFSAESFRKGNWRERAPLAVDLLANKNLYIGKSEKQLHKELGKLNGFFWRDSIPAYIIEDGLETGKDSWQVVFFIGMDDEIDDIRIYQNN